MHMHSDPPNPKKSKARRFLYGFIALSSCAIATGCGASPDPGGASAEGVTTVRSAVSSPAIQYQYLYSQSPDPNAKDAKSTNLITALQLMATITKDAAGISSKVSGIAVGVNDGINLLEFLGILPKPPDEVAKLTQDVNAIGTGITWQDLETYIDAEYSQIETTALVEVPRYGSSYVAAGMPGDYDSSQALLALYLPAAWQRAAIGSGNDSSTDQSLSIPIGQPYEGTLVWSYLDNWKRDIKPPAIANNLVFDWRLGAPFLLKAIALRLVIISAEDPNFPIHHQFDSELELMRSNLQAQYQTMLNGVQCGSQDYDYAYNTTTNVLGRGCLVVCADIYSGMSALSAITPTSPTDYSSASCENNQYTEAFADMMNETAYTVRNKLPLFAMRSMIDLLYTLRHPGPDLTQATNRISPQSQRSLCVGTVGRSGAWGTNLQLAPCSTIDPSQYWVYNRTTGQIQNPNLGVCIDERWGFSYGTNIGVWGCDTPHPDADNPQGPADEIDNLAQEWTFDPESGQLRNAIGVAMNWFINPLSPGPAGPGNPIVTEVVAQGGGFDVPQLDYSSPSVNMSWGDTAIYDPPSPDVGATQCNVGGVWMHCCPTGYAMTGAIPDQNIFKCAPLTDATGAITLDTGTQRNGMHACPYGQVMVGLRLDQNLLACQALPANTVTAEWVDSGTQDAYPMHACDAGFPTMAMSGIRADQNLWTCASTSEVQ
jgi:hypothetical protein